MRTLVIGYGNTLRGDDGVGYYVAEQVAAWNLPEVWAIACHQLTPELAAEIAVCDRVFFVDAAFPDTIKTVKVQLLHLPQNIPVETHCSNPEGLLHLAAKLYNHFPESYQILIPTQSIDFTEHLSNFAQAGKQVALNQIQRHICSA